jgi:hypothetical protein
MLSVVMLNVIMDLIVKQCDIDYARFGYAECCDAEFHYGSYCIGMR